jgi:hypothetical protein
VIYGQLNIVDSMVRNLYGEALKENMRLTDGVLTRYFKEVVANMPPPPDPFWKEWQI